MCVSLPQDEHALMSRLASIKRYFLMYQVRRGGGHNDTRTRANGHTHASDLQGDFFGHFMDIAAEEMETVRDTRTAPHNTTFHLKTSTHNMTPPVSVCSR